MMSFNNISLSSIVWKQYQYKQKSYVGMYMSLMVLQLIAILISIEGTLYTGETTDVFTLNMHQYSADVAFFFTVIWGGISAILLTTKGYWIENFMFVTNRLSNHLANIALLTTVSIVGGITALLTKYVNVVIHYILRDEPIIQLSTLESSELIVGVLTMIFYILLASAIGYVYGIILQWNRFIAIVIPILLVGLSFGIGYIDLYATMYDFYLQETSFLLFIIKMLVTISVLFGLAIVLSNRKEELK
ncbi:hypothetical protein [Virgibacillus sp.]|nr:hypothetical protein [Virgibacillus sp.]NWO12326.1 hypothetical protein [Virgibacillus sp.]